MQDLPRCSKRLQGRPAASPTLFNPCFTIPKRTPTPPEQWSFMTQTQSTNFIPVRLSFWWVASGASNGRMTACICNLGLCMPPLRCLPCLCWSPANGWFRCVCAPLLVESVANLWLVCVCSRGRFLPVTFLRGVCLSFLSFSLLVF
jgi:hypothetical protein